jgi:TRAP-type mannitol/chloroaromatic compound transport system substrate-binding protein
MRHFVRSVLALACAATFAAPAQAQQATTLKMQATWPASLTLYENFTYFAERIQKVSGGQLKIDAMPAGQVVPAFEVLDATHKKVLDGAHAWSGYWVGKNKTAILFTGGPGGTFGMDMIDALGWMHHGGGIELRSSSTRSSSSTCTGSRFCLRDRRRSAGSSARSRTSPTSRA